MLTLVMGSSAARMIGLGCIPIMTRIYSPEDYGILALFTSFIAILVPFATLKYSTAIPLPKTDVMAINLLILGLFLIGGLSIIIGIPLLFFGDTILSWFNAAELAQWWWLIVLGVAGSACNELFSLWGTRKRKYKTIAKMQFTQSLIGNVTKISLGLLALKPFGLIFGQFLAQSSGVGSLIKGSMQDFKINASSISVRRIKFVAAYYREFAYYRLPSQIFMVISIQAPVLIIAKLYDKEITGQFSLAIMAISLPAGLIGSSMSQAFYAEIANLGRHNIIKIKEITIDIQKRLFIVGIPSTLLLVFIAEPAFSFIFGKEWVVSGYFAATLAPYVLLQLTSAPLVQLLNIMGSQLTFLMINIFRLIGLSIIFIWFLKNGVESDIFVITLSVFNTFYYLSISVFIIYLIDKNTRIKNVK